MTKKFEIKVKVNGESFKETVEPRMLASDFIRDQLRLTGTHVGCEHGVCGACTILVNGKTIRSCLKFAIQLNNSEIETIESFGSIGKLNDIQAAFKKNHALQCGFCTPGFLITIKELLETEKLETEEEIRKGLSGNLCRCTGYENIVKAVQELVEKRKIT
jgi:aerobic-type carbon monoxide dehydrogenase small subunit (CoxS/CutS family)|tara:strand:+ start:1997 stop:2476 length:480 start_codon:yes stop_codon:yes gene_type:complete